MSNLSEKIYMHSISGDVAKESEWRDDFENMDIESWFGLPSEECGDLDWIEGGKLVEVKKNEEGEWEEV